MEIYTKALQVARGRLYRNWRHIESGVVEMFNVTRTNLRYIMVIEKQCHPLYLSGPVSIFLCSPQKICNLMREQKYHFDRNIDNFQRIIINEEIE
jgi:hypothetical protein